MIATRLKRLIRIRTHRMDGKLDPASFGLAQRILAARRLRNGRRALIKFSIQDGEIKVKVLPF